MARTKWEPSAEILEQITEWVGNGMTEGSIALKLGLNPSTFSLKKKDYPELVEAVETGLAIDRELCEHRLRKIAFDMEHKGHLTALIFYLKGKHKWNDNAIKVVTTNKVSGLNLSEISNKDE